MSQLSSAWRKFVKGLGLSPEATGLLIKYGLWALLGAAIVLALFVLL